MFYHIFALLIALAFSTQAFAHEFITLKMLQGNKIAPYIQDILQLCNDYYSQYPYFYQVEDDDYQRFLKSYSKKPNAIVCMAFDHGTPIGLATGIPMSDNRDNYKQPFIDNGYDISEIFYVGELVLLPQYRGKGIGTDLYFEIENFARDHGNYETIAFCQIDPQNVSAQPANYVPMDHFWEKQGFNHHPELDFVIYWTNINEQADTPHNMTYWLKSIEPVYAN